MLQVQNDVLQTQLKLLEIKFKDNGSRVKHLEEQIAVMNAGMQKETSQEIQQLNLENSSSRMHTPISMDTFDGTNWDVFSTRFECISNGCGWAESEKLIYLIQYLKGEAADFVFVKCVESERSSYHKLSSALEQRFGAPRPSHLCHISQLAELSLTTEGCFNGCLPAYFTDIRYLVRKAFPDVDEKARVQIEVDYFIQNIETPELRLTVGMKSPRNIQTAREMVETFIRVEKEAVYVQQKARISNVTISSSDEPLKEPSKGQQVFNCLKQLTKLLVRKKSRNSKKNRRCYACRCTGHYAQECNN